MTTKLLLAGALIALLILPAGAQQAPQGTPTRVRGTVEKLDGQALTVNSREGETVAISLADHVAVAYLVKKNVGDIKPGDYIASTGIKGNDGKLHAIEVRIFPESLRGAGEGQYPWDLKPDSVMTRRRWRSAPRWPPWGCPGDRGRFLSYAACWSGLLAVEAIKRPLPCRKGSALVERVAIFEVAQQRGIADTGIAGFARLVFLGAGPIDASTGAPGRAGSS